MPLLIQNIEESLSVSYVSAIVAKAGASLDIVSKDFGVDVSIRRIDTFDGKLVDMGAAFDCQLKATTNWVYRDGKIVYDIEADVYNKLIYRNKNSITPCILVLLCLPKEEENWLTISVDKLILRKCCYYDFIKGEPTLNRNSIRIRIPERNLFSPKEVNELIKKSVKGDI